KRCPDLRVLPPDMEMVEQASHGMARIAAQYTPRWEVSRPGHIYLDLTQKRVRTKTGRPMMFMTFEDQSSTFETVLFPKTYHRFCHLFISSRPYILNGRVDMTFNAVTLTVDHVTLLNRINSLGSGLSGDAVFP
ncbi:MAG: hypothetical protein R6U38_15205, partial [Desulfatiglandaceae bacterium]